MDFMTSIKYNFENYFSITGRASRSEYWWFTLFMLILYVIAGIMDSVVGFPIFYLTTALILLAPSICVAIRRMHDVNKSGWWLLVSFIPLVGALYLLYLLVTKGTDGDNDFGADPLT